jgi:hypothetical protein
VGLGIPIRIESWPSLPCSLPMPTLGLRQHRSVCIVLWVPICGGLVCVVLGSSNAALGLVSVVLGVPIHIELDIVVVRSPNADVGPASFWVLPKPVVLSLTYPFAVCWHASFCGSQLTLGFWYSLGRPHAALAWGSSSLGS